MYFLGIDFGGGASKATLLRADGVIAATASVEVPTHYPFPGHVEQSPENWVYATRVNIAAVLKKSGVAPSQIAALALDAATHTAVLMDERFRVLQDAIYWTDSRSRAECEYLRENHLDLIRTQTLHSPDPIWTLPQLMWVRDHQPEVFQKCRRILFTKDYVRYRLTGTYCTDEIEAEGSMLFDYQKKCWSAELCGILGFDIALLPPVVKPGAVVGGITREAATLTGLAEGTPVVCGTTDTVMEVFASGAVIKGQMTVKLATAGRICIVTDHPYPDPNLINYSHIVDGLWYPGTATKSCAASYRWYRDTFGGSYSELDAGAKMAPVGADGLLFHPYLNGELTPYGDPLLRGSFTGIRAGQDRGAFSRAVMEGVAFSLLDSKRVIDQLGIAHENRAVIIGGGAASPIWRQIISDMLGIPLVEPACSDSSFGTAMLAGIAVGAFSSPEEALRVSARQKSITDPIAENTRIYQEIFPRYQAIHDALAPIYHGDYEK